MTEAIVKPHIVAFEVTDRCILRCRHCRAAASNSPSHDPLDTAACKKIIDGLAAYTKCVLIFTGGEPIMRGDIIELIHYSKTKGLRPVMATCGYHINPQTAARLKEAGLLSFSFSLDGKEAASHDAFRQVPGAFDMTLKAVDVARQANIRFQFNTTLTKLNAPDMEAIAELAVRQGASCWNPFILVPVGRANEIRDLLFSPEEYEALLHRLAEIRNNLKIEFRLTCGPQFARVARQKQLPAAQSVNGCLAATDFAFISHTGCVQTCGFLDLSAGSLPENDFDFGRIWKTSDLLCSLRRYDQYKGACRSCGFLRMCRGCRARAQAVYGDYLQQDPICRLACAHKTESSQKCGEL
jgi:radical SAM protein with 4Fe4S-binding SPASM domain